MPPGRFCLQVLFPWRLCLLSLCCCSCVSTLQPDTPHVTEMQHERVCSQLTNPSASTEAKCCLDQMLSTNCRSRPAVRRALPPGPTPAAPVPPARLPPAPSTCTAAASTAAAAAAPAVPAVVAAVLGSSHSSTSSWRPPCPPSSPAADPPRGREKIIRGAGESELFCRSSHQVHLLVMHRTGTSWAKCFLLELPT